MKYLYTKKINKKQEEQIFNILCEADKEFIPHLSNRTSTYQNNLLFNLEDEKLPYSYFDKIKMQSALMAVQNDDIVGFMSFVEEYEIELGGKRYDTLYLSTLIVKKEYRKQGISFNLYKNLMDTFSDKSIITRTWSTNESHLKLLDKLGFELLECIENDRGIGIDTVYYGRIK